MKKLLAKKRNNKGFSLVELIVVILIMAIIAVALAPQVMKWVGSSRDSTDDNNMATIKSAVSTAVADYMSDGGTIPAATYHVTSSGVKWQGTGEDTALTAKITEVMTGDYPEVKAEKNKVFVITITAESGAVKVEVGAGTYGSATPTPEPAAGT